MLACTFVRWIEAKHKNLALRSPLRRHQYRDCARRCPTRTMTPGTFRRIGTSRSIGMTNGRSIGLCSNQSFSSIVQEYQSRISLWLLEISRHTQYCRVGSLLNSSVTISSRKSSSPLLEILQLLLVVLHPSHIRSRHRNLKPTLHTISIGFQWSRLTSLHRRCSSLRVHWY